MCSRLILVRTHNISPRRYSSNAGPNPYTSNTYKHNNILNLATKNLIKPDKIKHINKKPLTFGGVCLLVIPAFTFSLGCWQVQRWYWKVQLIDELKKQIALNVVQFPFEDLSKLETMEFNKVELEGEFIHEREFLIFPRGRFDPEFQKNDRGGGLIASNTSSSSGAHIIAPFKIKGTDLIVMVNRGWVPQTHMAKSARKGTFPTGPQRLTAIIRKSEGRPQFVSENNIAKGIWFYKNFKQMGEYCGSAPIFLDATTEHSYFPNGPIAGQTNVEIRNKHVEYLATWYSLTALTLIMWYARFIK